MRASATFGATVVLVAGVVLLLASVSLVGGEGSVLGGAVLGAITYGLVVAGLCLALAALAGARGTHPERSWLLVGGSVLVYALWFAFISIVAETA